MASIRYVALTGISFDGLRGKPRVEIGDPLPDNVPDATIQELLHDGVIEEAIEEVKPKPKPEAKK